MSQSIEPKPDSAHPHTSAATGRATTDAARAAKRQPSRGAILARTTVRAGGPAGRSGEEQGRDAVGKFAEKAHFEPTRMLGTVVEEPPAWLDELGPDSDIAVSASPLPEPDWVPGRGPEHDDHSLGMDPEEYFERLAEDRYDENAELDRADHEARY